MKRRTVLWGKDANDAKALIALELSPDENLVKAWIYADELATESLGQQLLSLWENEKDMELPEGARTHEAPLTVNEPLLPDDIMPEKEDVLKRAQTEWHFMVLSAKLNAVYVTELQELEERIDKLEAYSKQEWETLKEFWAKVSEQAREKNLFKEHTSAIKERVNGLFAKLKDQRSTMDKALREQAKVQYAAFAEQLSEIEDRIAKNINLKTLFEELKAMQADFNKARLTKELRNDLWKRMDQAFKVVKEKKYGKSNESSANGEDRLARRYEGLMDAIKKMENSIKRDESDLTFQRRKIDSVNTGQLETQIRQAKLAMIEERVQSKREKLEDMYKTKVMLEDRIEKAKAREAARAEKEAAKAREAAQKAAEKAAEKAAQKAAEKVAAGEQAPAPTEAPEEVPTEATPPADEAPEAPVTEVATEAAPEAATEAPTVPAEEETAPEATTPEAASPADEAPETPQKPTDEA